jgi:glycosyltransferase involved in cell wall biosynthesis
MHGVWLFEPGFMATVAGRLLRVPSLASVGGVEVVGLPQIGVGGLLTWRGRILSRFVLNRAGLVTGGSRYALTHARHVASRRTRGAFRFAPLPVNTELYAPRCDASGADGGVLRLLHVANLNAVKDQTTLLRAFAILHRTQPAATLRIVGADPAGLRAGLEQVANALDISHALTFSGILPQHELPGVYQEADAFVLSSRYESQGMVVLEAAASGVVTAGTAVGVVPDLSPEAAIATPVGDAAGLAHALLRLAGDPALRQVMGQAALARVRSDYAYAPAAQRFVNIYAELIYGLIAEGQDQ